MRKIALQISPEARTAYFADYLDVAETELAQVTGLKPEEFVQFGELEFFLLNCPEERDEELLKLSFVQGLFEIGDGSYFPLNKAFEYQLHRDFVFGSKFKGKTNERLTQLLLNVGLSVIDCPIGEPIRLLDPMCGRGTTIMWGMQYGFRCKGIDRDEAALEDIVRNTKKWCKVHRTKNKFERGALGDKKRRNSPRYLDVTLEGQRARFVTGDARKPSEYFGSEKFNLIVSDLPYGIQHFGDGDTRNPLELLSECAVSWREVLAEGGAVVLAFNKKQPKRDQLIAAFESAGWTANEFAAPHRMSESIVRDIVIFTS